MAFTRSLINLGGSLHCSSLHDHGSYRPFTSVQRVSLIPNVFCLGALSDADNFALELIVLVEEERTIMKSDLNRSK